MKDIEELKKIAVLIDADNAQLSKMKSVLDEISTYGRITVKNAYGDWKKPILKNWEDEMKRLAIKPVQQFAYTIGKNATDIAMVIDAMDLLATKIYDAFVLISSDSDFTPLAIRLRESGAYIIGVGEEKTPPSFRSACDEFILIEYIASVSSNATVILSDKVADVANVAEPEKSKSKITDSSRQINIDDVHELLKIAYEKYQDGAGFVNISAAGAYMKRAKPDFNPLVYGFAKLPDLLKGFPQKYEIKRTKG
ncbi:MAG: NYN domain-containing protein, partial [Oscillospiraceae bacterium]